MSVHTSRTVRRAAFETVERRLLMARPSSTPDMVSIRSGEDDGAPPPTAVVSGTIFSDANRNGRRDSGEAVLAGRSVFADYNYNGRFDVGEPTTLSDAAGAYSLQTRVSEVSVRVITQHGEAVSLPYGATSIWLSSINGTSSGKHIGIMSASAQPLTVKGTVFSDTNRNGIMDDNESRLIGRTVFADDNFNGRLDVGERTATTLSDGTYSLSLAGSSASIRLVINAGETLSLPYGATSLWIANGSGTVAGKNLGLYGTLPSNGNLQFIPFFDSNFNRVRDAGEKVIQLGQLGVDFNRNGTLDDIERVDVRSGAAAGMYTLSLPHGIYTLFYQQTILGRPIGDVHTMSVSVLGGTTSTVFAPLVLDDASFNVDGYVYLDENGNGRYNSYEAEPWVAGQTLFADYDYDGVRDANEPTVVTTADGRYRLVATRPDFALVLVTTAGYRPASATPKYIDLFSGLSWDGSYGVVLNS